MDPWLFKDWRQALTATAIDTLKLAQELERANFTRQPAEAQANANNSALNEGIATKHDLKELEFRLTMRLSGIMAACLASLAKTSSRVLISRPFAFSKVRASACNTGFEWVLPMRLPWASHASRGAPLALASLPRAISL